MRSKCPRSIFVIAVAQLCLIVNASTLTAVDAYMVDGVPHLSIAAEMQPRASLTPTETTRFDENLDDELSVVIRGDADTSLPTPVHLLIQRRSALRLRVTQFAVRDWLNLPTLDGVGANALCAIDEIASRGGVMCASGFSHPDCAGAVASACCSDLRSSRRRRPLGHYCLVANCSRHLEFYELDSSSARLPYEHNITVTVRLGAQVSPCASFGVSVSSQASVTLLPRSALCNISASGFVEVLSVRPTSTLTGVAQSFVLAQPHAMPSAPLVLFHREELAGRDTAFDLHRGGHARDREDWCDAPIHASPVAFLSPHSLNQTAAKQGCGLSPLEHHSKLIHSQLDALLNSAVLNSRWGAYPRGRNFSNYIASDGGTSAVFHRETLAIAAPTLRDDSAATRLTVVFKLPQ